MKSILAALSLLIAATAHAASLETELPRLIQAAEIPGASMAAIRDGRVSWTGAAGVIAPGSAVTFEGGSLHYQRDGRPRYRLTPIGTNLFAVEGNGSFRVRFAKDGSKLAVLQPDGEDESARMPGASSQSD